jgi:hypothetical protein
VTVVLFDTNVVSETIASRPDTRALGFIASVHAPLLSVITFDELTYGAERAPDPVRQGTLISWIRALRAQFADRLVVVDVDVAEISGRLRALERLRGRVLRPMDALIAACAISRRAALATRNIKDFQMLGLPLIDPWSV